MARLSPELRKALAPHLQREDFPGGGPFDSVDSGGIRRTAAALGVTPARAMIACLEDGIWPRRFCRNRGIFSAARQARLLDCRAAIIGCGGLGGHVATLLARLGVGGLTLCDPDHFAESNLNRQILCREDRIGMNKALAAQEEMRLIASHAEVRAVPEAATEENLPDILQGARVVMDCLDSVDTRLVVARAARKTGLPFVYGAVAGEEGFAMLERPDGSSCLERLYPGGEERSLRAEHIRGVPTLTPAATAVLQCLLALRALLAPESGGKEGLWHLDLSVPELELLLV